MRTKVGPLTNRGSSCHRRTPLADIGQHLPPTDGPSQTVGDPSDRLTVPKSTDRLDQAARRRAGGLSDRWRDSSYRRRAAETTLQVHKVTVDLPKPTEGPSVHRKISSFDRGPYETIKGPFRPTKGFCKKTEDPSEREDLLTDRGPL